MKRKRIFSLLLAFALFLMLLPVPRVSATVRIQEPSDGTYVRIRYVGNSRYVDLPADGITANGTQLQLWDYAYGHQNQVFRLIKSGNYWQIIAWPSGKVIEVRDSSHEDYAAVSQWAAHSLNCAKWSIISNTNGTVSFKNCESGKFLNVSGGGDAQNGTPLIQYHDDGTIAMQFYLEAICLNDVLSATFDRKLTVSSMKWTQFNPVTSYTVNDTGWQIRRNGKLYHPAVGQKVFVSAEYLSPSTVANLIKEKSYSKSTWKEIASALAGDMTEQQIANLLKKLEFGDVPGLGTALGILQVLANSRDAAEWNRFLDATNVDARGHYSGVIVYTYQTIVDVPVRGFANNGTTKIVTWHHIRKSTSVEYGTWTGDNFASVTKLPVENARGSWYFMFK